jgi:LysM repeat protein
MSLSISPKTEIFGGRLMQPDQKVGLALGVLLIGVVAAFFFRNEPDPAQRAPALSRAEAVHREIAEKRLAPYFSDLAKADRAAKPDEQETSERRLPRWNEPPPSDPFAGADPDHSVPAPAPDPIQIEGHRDDSVAERRLIPEAVPSPSPAPSAEFHVVQRGDTLSSIAGKYLGSQARFREIFDANRDQLQSADDLQIGMKLRIPDGGTATIASPSTDRSGSPLKPKPVSATHADDVADFPDQTQSGAGSLESADRPGRPSTATQDSRLRTPDWSASPDEAPKWKFTPSKRRPAR